LLVGAALAMSGAVTQVVIRNSPASPYVIGLTKGAGLAAGVVVIVFPSAASLVLSVALSLGACAIRMILSLWIIWLGIDGSPLALNGMAIGAVAMA
ncbi:iron chelate uptake ABC transporter family permease subunit, partial [Staphylococcus pseudintermedius]|uniref:iron chelate uptake ABC transporter family permease subunit n=1 Tax=Staphylococcus pseudintermedius TaxID=283734 RepID=UPI000E38E409